MYTAKCSHTTQVLSFPSLLCSAAHCLCGLGQVCIQLHCLNMHSIQAALSVRPLDLLNHCSSPITLDTLLHHHLQDGLWAPAGAGHRLPAGRHSLPHHQRPPRAHQGRNAAGGYTAACGPLTVMLAFSLSPDIRQGASVHFCCVCVAGLCLPACCKGLPYAILWSACDCGSRLATVRTSQPAGRPLRRSPHIQTAQGTLQSCLKHAHLFCLAAVSVAYLLHECSPHARPTCLLQSMGRNVLPTILEVTKRLQQQSQQGGARGSRPRETIPVFFELCVARWVHQATQLPACPWLAGHPV